MNTGRELRKEFFLNLIVGAFTAFFGLILANIFFLSQSSIGALIINVVCACSLIVVGIKITYGK